MRELTFVIPGLLWPADSAAQVAGDLALTALGALLARATVRRQPAQTMEQILATHWGVADAAPYAALRLAGSGSEPGDAVWMCADPVHLRFARESLVLTDNHELEVTQEEAQQLVDTLNAHFADLGTFRLGTPGQWYLQLHAAPSITTHPVSQVIGRHIEAWLPAGPASGSWRRTINEMQMLLHTHPVNVAREDAGRPTINSLWPWGAGRLADAPAKAFDAVLADAPLARGLARCSGGSDAPLPPGLTDLAHARTLALLDVLDYPALARDAATWRDAMQVLETHWFAPALALLKAGRLDAVRLLLPGDLAHLEVECRKPRWWSLGKSAMPLDTFLRQQAAS